MATCSDTPKVFWIPDYAFMGRFFIGSGVWRLFSLIIVQSVPYLVLTAIFFSLLKVFSGCFSGYRRFMVVALLSTFLLLPSLALVQFDGSIGCNRLDSLGIFARFLFRALGILSRWWNVRATLLDILWILFATGHILCIIYVDMDMCNVWPTSLGIHGKEDTFNHWWPDPIGNSVLLTEQSQSRREWITGRVIETYPGKDELVRVVS